MPFLITQRVLRVPFLIAQRALKVPFSYKVTVPFFVPGVNTNYNYNSLPHILKPSSNWSLFKLIISDQTLIKLK